MLQRPAEFKLSRGIEHGCRFNLDLSARSQYSSVTRTSSNDLAVACAFIQSVRKSMGVDIFSQLQRKAQK